VPRPIEVVVADEGQSRLALILPPLEEIREIQALSSGNFSLKDFAEKTKAILADDYAEELKKLLSKRKRFDKSPTFLTHLANLAELAGDRAAEYGYLTEAREVSKSPIFNDRLGSNLLARNKVADAETMFRTADLDKDIGANLRLAYVYATRNDLLRAESLVQKAIEIDKTDFRARLFEGALHLYKGRVERALRSFRIAAEEREQSSALFTNIAIAHILSGRSDKAFKALRRATNLEPFNRNAVALLADLAYQERTDEIATKPLREFLAFEQKSAAMWARMARALSETGQNAEALEALKRQASVEESSSVWNNMGVAYTKLKNSQRAMECFKYAAQKAESESSKDFGLPMRNFLAVLAEQDRPKELYKLSGIAIASDTDDLFLSDPIISDIYVFHMHAMSRVVGEEEATAASERLLNLPKAATRLRAWLVMNLLGYYAKEQQWGKADVFFSLAGEVLKELSPQDRRREGLLNNSAYMLLELGKIEEAEKLLKELGSSIHKEPYATATLGLYHFRRGHLDRAEELYREAIRLAKVDSDRERIAQKLNLELGRVLLKTSPNRAKRLLQKAAERSAPIEQFKREAQRLLRGIHEQ
jgi:tetratricopeptide (TPR) repeat protein